VRAGSSALDKGSILHEVTKIISYAKFNTDIELNYDIALLKVSTV
jgi:hypothetical protein